MKGSKRIVWLIGAWVAATAATAGVALAVVGLAGDQLNDEAVQPLSAAEVEALGLQVPVPTAAPAEAPATAPAADPGATVTSSTAPASSAPQETSTTVTSSSIPTTTVPAATPTTQAGTTTTTTTNVPEAAQVDSRKITGGTVVVRWTSSSVELVSASPDDGYSVDVEKRGPNKVEVEFEGGGITSKYAAEISDGQLVVQTEVENEGDGD